MYIYIQERERDIVVICASEIGTSDGVPLTAQSCVYVAH